MGVHIYVAHKDGYMAGMVAGNMDPKRLAKYLSSFVKSGCELQPTANHDEYMAFIKPLKNWHEAPWWKSSKAPSP